MTARPASDALLVRACAERRATVAALAGDRSVVVCAGVAPSRNYPANRYPFRASSHFLHLVGMSIEGATLVSSPSGATLFVPVASPDDALWHGEAPSIERLAETLGLRVRPEDELSAEIARTRPHALPSFDPSIRGRLDALAVETAEGAAGARLADAFVSSRLLHDELAIRELRRAAAISARAHVAGMSATRPGISAAVPRAVMEAVMAAHGAVPAYGSIVTPRGDVLHAGPTDVRLAHADLLLCDVGAEAPSGYASDVTRTYPVSGRFESEARALYEVVLDAQREAIASASPGTRYRDVHLVAMRSLARGLVALGLVAGDAEERVHDGTVALFFPHGVGHLLGLDVHDLEDLGDRAGYAPGRVRSTEPGLRYLRLDRDLEPGMAFTIEPGVYFVDAILGSAETRRAFAGRVDFTAVDRFAPLRGIRIEDDVLLREDGVEVLTRRIPKTVTELEEVVGAGADWGALFLADPV